MKRIILITSLLILFTLPLVVTGASRPAPAAANFQLQFNFGLAYSHLGQDGEKRDSQHKGEIDVLSIVSIDRVNGIVTARDLRTGETFKFEVDSRSLLKTMRVGQKVWKQAGGTKVGITEGGAPCCDIVGKGNASPGGRTASSTANASSGATIEGKTLILKKGYEASIDPKNRGVVRVRDLGGRGATAEYTCGCDPDEPNAEGNPETCRFYNDGDRLKCMSPTCKDCDVSDTTKLGTDKPQDEASPGVSTSPATATSGGRTDPGRTLVSSRVRWEVKPSADMKGATGQIVIQFPGMTSSGNNTVAVFEVGGKDRITTATYGNKNFPLLDGEYDVDINSARVTRVPVKRGMDTRIYIGTISFNVPSDVSVEVYDITQKKRLCLAYGPMKCGVPSGEYYVKVGGSSKKVTLADGQVIDF